MHGCAVAGRPIVSEFMVGLGPVSVGRSDRLGAMAIVRPIGSRFVRNADSFQPEL